MWKADKIDEAQEADGRLRHVIVISDETRKLPPWSVFGDVVSQVRDRVKQMNAQDTEQTNHKLEKGPIDLTEPDATPLTPRQTYLQTTLQLETALYRQRIGWPNDDVVATLRKQLFDTYQPEYND